MMELTKNLNKVADAPRASRFQKLINLVPHKNYRILKMENFSTRYGPTLLAYCEGEELPVLFPLQFHSKFGGDKVDETNQQLQRSIIYVQIGVPKNNIVSLRFVCNVEDDDSEDDEPVVPKKKKKNIN